MPQAPSHPEVNQETSTAFEPKNQILAAPLERRHDLAFELGRDRPGIERPGQARVVDLDAIEATAHQQGLETEPNGLDLGQLGHVSSVAVSPWPVVYPIV